MKLYESSIAIEELWQVVEGVICGDVTEDPDGNPICVDEALQRLEIAIANHEGERDEKAVEIACLIKNWLAEADAIKVEKVRLQKRQSAREKAADRLKGYLSGFIPEGEKIQSAKAEIAWRKSEAVSVSAEPEDLPEQFIRIERRPVLSTIKKALKSGEEIAGCELQTKQNIQIK